MEFLVLCFKISKTTELNNLLRNLHKYSKLIIFLTLILKSLHAFRLLLPYLRYYGTLNSYSLMLTFYIYTIYINSPFGSELYLVISSDKVLLTYIESFSIHAGSRNCLGNNNYDLRKTIFFCFFCCSISCFWKPISQQPSAAQISHNHLQPLAIHMRFL